MPGVHIAMHRKIGLVTVYAEMHKLRQKAARYPHPSEHGGVRFPVMAGVGPTQSEVGCQVRNVFIFLGRDNRLDAAQWIISALNGLSSLVG